MRDRLRAALRQTVSAGTLITIALILVGAYVSESEILQRRCPVIVRVEVGFHQLISLLDFREHKSRFVTLIEVDDGSFWHSPFSGVQPTNRRALADIARNAAEQGAVVIAVDFAWKSPLWQPGDDSIRANDNKYLLETIREIATGKVTRRPVPVVVTTGLVQQQSGEWIREPNIFEDSVYEQAGATVGHINLPLYDQRLVPLQMKAWEWNSKYQREFDSFAFKIARAYEDVTHTSPSLADNNSIREAMSAEKWVFGGFLPDQRFLKVPAQDVLKKTGKVNLCQNRIAIIGGTWHQYSENHGPPIESFRSPVGTVPGLLLHANYVESLLDGRFGKGVSPKVAVLADLALALTVYFVVRLPKGILARLGVSLALFGPILLAYALVATAGIYLDFVIPLFLVIAHLVIEHYSQTPHGAEGG